MRKELCMCVKSISNWSKKTSNNSENSSQGPPDKLRLQHTTLKKTAKQKDEKLQEKEDEI